MPASYSVSRELQRRLMMARKTAYQTIRPQRHQSCLFVAGMQRSGTNMVMDVLEESVNTQVFHETDPRAFSDYELLDHDVLHALVEKSRAGTVVFKALLESDLIPNLLQEFAPARAIWPVRDYRDVVNSAKRSFPHLKRTIQRVVMEPGDYWQSRGISEETHEILRELYADDLSIEESAALFWFARNRLYFEKKMHENKNILLTRYEDLVTRPREVFPEIFDFAGIPFHNKHANRVHAGSIARYPKPVLRNSISAVCEDLSLLFKGRTAKLGAVI